MKDLCDICNDKKRGDFKRYYGKIVYCGIKVTEPGVICAYRSNMPDHNSLYRCLELTANLKKRWNR